MAWNAYSGVPVVVAANRDEVLNRAAAPPALSDAGAVYAPVDLVGGGTWLGLRRTGLFVGVTNRFGVPRDDGRESRGALVREALGETSAVAIHARLSKLSPTRFNAFHLLYADAAHAFVTWSDGAVLAQAALAPGLHVVTERSLGGDDLRRTEAVEAFWARECRGPTAPPFEVLRRLLALRQGPESVADVCVSLPDWNYGTRSSFVAHVAPSAAETRCAFADVAPLPSAWREVNPFA